MSHGGPGGATVGNYVSLRKTTTAEARQVGLKIFKYCDTKDKVLMSIGCLTALLSGAGMPAYSQIQGNIIGELSGRNTANIMSKMEELAIVLVVMGACMMVLQGVRGYCLHYTTMRQTTRIKLLYFEALMRQEVAWHDAHPPGELTSRMDGDVKVVERAMGDNLMLGLQHIGTLGFAYGIGFYNGWELTLFMLAATPFIAGMSVFFGRFVVKTSRQTREGYAKAGGIALEAIDNIKTVQVFGREYHESERFAEAILPAMKSGMLREMATFMSTGCNNCVIYVTYGLGFWFGAYLITWGRNDVGQVVTIFFACLMASFSVGRLSPCLSTFIEGAGAASKIFEVIDRMPAMDPISGLDDPEAMAAAVARTEEVMAKRREANAAEEAERAKQREAPQKIPKEKKKKRGSDGDDTAEGDEEVTYTTQPPVGIPLPNNNAFSDAIVFKGVSFSYPTRKEDRLFTNLNMTIKKGQTVAFSGASGCGKSSIIGLLQRYYDPTGGAVVVDGVDMRDLNLRGWRDCISIVSQEPKLFTGTVMENVKIARPDATDEEVIAACKKAHVHQVIDKLPQKYDTLVGTGGSQLSGGQKQRVAIARALIRNPQILILDEATSALDRKSEIEVQAALEDVMFRSRNTNKAAAGDDVEDANADPLTVVVIAHRLATIQNADVIHYVNHDDVQGSWIEESGTYEELMAMDGHFAAMTKKQGAADLNTEAASRDGTNAAADDDDAIIAAADAAFADVVKPNTADATPTTNALSTSPEAAAVVTISADGASTVDDDDGAGGAKAPLLLDDEDEALFKAMKAKSLKELDTEGVAAMPSQHLRVLSMCSGDRWAIAVGCLGCVIAGLDYPAYAIIFVYMLEALAKLMWDDDVIHNDIPIWCSCFFIIAVVSVCAHGLMCCFAIAGQHLTLKLRRVLFYSILRQDMTFFDTPGRDSSSLATILSTDTEVVHGLWGPSIGSRFQLLATLTGGIVISMVYSWRCALVTLAVFPTFLILLIVCAILLKAFGADDDNAIKAEALTNIRTVISLNLQDKMVKRYTEHVHVLEHKQRYNAIIKAVQGGGMGIIMFCIMAMIAWYSGKLISSGTNNFLEVMVAQQAVMVAMRGVNEANEVSARFADAANATKRVFYIIDRQPAVSAAPPADLKASALPKKAPSANKRSSSSGQQNAPDCTTADGGDDELTSISTAPNGGTYATSGDDANPFIKALKSVELSDLKFRYPARPEAPLLRGVDLEFTMPQTYGLMGETGCGKSTLVGLLTRFYDPAAGTVTVTLSDGQRIPMPSVDLVAWRESISLVLQEPSLFSGTIRENILYAKPNATQAEVEQAAKYAAIHDDIMLMPDGYDTDVGYKGQSLSGGQKQRVAIARALIRKPRILLMDEATSALDNNTEGRVEQGIRDACKANEMIVIAVAHRLTTIRDSDSIAVMEAGRVKEKGSHDELIALGGHYKDRWQLFESTAGRQRAALMAAGQ